MMKPGSIRVISIGLFRRDEAILVFDSFDAVKGLPIYRPLGGGVLPGETSEAALRREIREELSQEVDALRLLGILESIFEYDGQAGHEIVFVYDAQFADASLYARDTLNAYEEENGELFQATWRPLTSFDDYHRLVPEGLADLIARSASAH